MEIEFDDDDLEDLACNPRATAGKGEGVDKGFWRVMQLIRASRDERDLYNMKSFHFEKLKGKRNHQHSLRINKQWRLIIELREENNRKRIVVISIEDYH